MGRRATPRMERIDVPEPLFDLARRRTAFAAELAVHFDRPLREALASAWLQGLSDAIDVLQEGDAHD